MVDLPLETAQVKVVGSPSSVAIALRSTAVSSCPIVECKSLSRTVLNGASASVEVDLWFSTTATTVFVALVLRSSTVVIAWVPTPVEPDVVGVNHSQLIASTKQMILLLLIGICLHYHGGRSVQHNKAAVRLQATARTYMAKRLLLVLLYENDRCSSPCPSSW
jgi:hypothetical protein